VSVKTMVMGMDDIEADIDFDMVRREEALAGRSYSAYSVGAEPTGVWAAESIEVVGVRHLVSTGRW